MGLCDFCLSIQGRRVAKILKYFKFRWLAVSLYLQHLISQPCTWYLHYDTCFPTYDLPKSLLLQHITEHKKGVTQTINITSLMLHISVYIFILTGLRIVCTQMSALQRSGIKRDLIFTITSHFRGPSFTLFSILQNLVMFLSLLVAWVIPDVPKTIVEQLKREKKLLVDVFLREEKEKFQLIQSLFSKDATIQPGGNMLHPGQGPPIPGRYSTLPPGPTQGLANDRGGDGPRARCRAASFSQFTRKIPPSPRNENENSRHTAVWRAEHKSLGVL